jgi:hypothetical protein
MEAPRRWSIPVSLAVWLPILLTAFVLNDTRPNKGDPRWSHQWRAYYEWGEGMFWAWTLPALGIVWTLARLANVPAGERIGRRRMFWAWMKAAFGMSVVLALFTSYVADFNAADVGSLSSIATWLALALFMAMMSLAIVKVRARRPTLTARAAGLAGTAAAVAIGAFLYWSGLPEDKLKGLTGARRAEALVTGFYGIHDESLRRIAEADRTSGVGYRVFAAGDRLDMEVVVPWPEADARRQQQIAEFWNRPSPALYYIPTPPWHAEWRTSAEPPSLVFAIRQPANVWNVVMLGTASSEAELLAEAPWSDLRPLTTTLLDEHYLPSSANAGPEQSREIEQVTLLRLAFQLDRLAQACNAPSARAISGDPASEVLRSTAARARELRERLMTPDAPLPTQDLMTFADQVTELGLRSAWQRRPDGCAAFDNSEENVLAIIRDDLRKHAPAAK